MSAGNSLWNVQASSGQQQVNASNLARFLVQFGVCTGATPNQLINPGDQSSLRTMAGLGPLAEALAFRQRPGMPCYGMSLNPSVPGALGAVSSSGSGNAIVTASCAPHVAVLVKCVAGGALGTAAFKFSLDGGLTWSAMFTSSSSSPWTQMVPGTFCSLSFPTATYVLNTTLTVGIDGTVNPGTNWVGSVTQSSSPIDEYEFYLSVAVPGGFGAGMLSVSPDGGPTAGGSVALVQQIPSNGKIIVPNTGIVLAIGQHTVVVTVTTPGALGTAVLSVQIDGGTAITGITTAPNSGINFVYTATGTGVTFTFAPAAYVITSTYTLSSLGVLTIGGGGTSTVTAAWAGLQANDTFQFLCAPPSASTTDVNNAIAANLALRNAPHVAWHFVMRPSTSAGAASLQAVIEAGVELALNSGMDVQAGCEWPHASGRGGAGDIVVSAGVAIADTADNDAVCAAARGSDTNRTAVHVASYRLTSALNGFKLARGFGWLIFDRFVDTDPANDISAVANGALRAFIPPGALTIGRDESVMGGLDNVQFNTARTYPQQVGVYLTITDGGAGWKNCTTNAAWQDARGVRVLNILLQQLRPLVQQFMGQSPLTNDDGTIDEKVRRSWSTIIDTAAKRAIGLLPGGPFSTRQASNVSMSVSPSSQLGVSPKQLINNYFLQQLGFVSSERNNMFFSGAFVNGQQ